MLFFCEVSSHLFMRPGVYIWSLWSSHFSTCTTIYCRSFFEFKFFIIVETYFYLSNFFRIINIIDFDLYFKFIKFGCRKIVSMMFRNISNNSDDQVTKPTLATGFHQQSQYTTLQPQYNTKHPFVGDRSLRRARQALTSPSWTQRDRNQTQTNPAVSGGTSRLSWHTTKLSGK